MQNKIMKIYVNTQYMSISNKKERKELIYKIMKIAENFE